MRKLVVVLYSIHECAQDPTTRCLMEAYGPFESSEEAHAFMEKVPKEFLPHCLFMSEPGEK